MGGSEDLAGLFVVAMITLSSLLAPFAAIDRLVHPHHVTNLFSVTVAALSALSAMRSLPGTAPGVGRRIGSAALVAYGLHARTDGFTSLALLLGAAVLRWAGGSLTLSSGWPLPLPYWACCAPRSATSGPASSTRSTRPW